ncbi:phage integrase N-terminal SAM-like domain-containing protein [Fulvivirga sp. 29W222]|uniref:Phage integrase N-terminal SAM-like domain-containing protein n=1 Tax=Fulvivirga marina TaxID=2494733 RepID=A0A937KE11_9BACT|nr:site-specific integrase [Fulvivirga marina]MBL6446763.1 phage integrase N-terminal SAM-like domain-containing protein [Fulvivirga marina]
MDNQQLYTTYLQNRGCSKSTIDSYHHFCEHFIRWAENKHMEIEYITYSELLDYIASRKGKVTQKTIQGCMIAITHYFEALVQTEVIDQNPARYLDIKAPNNRKLYAILSRQQLDNLYHNFDINASRKTKPTAKASAIRNKITVGLMAFQGLDSTALSQLRVQDVDVLGGKITVKSSRTHAGRNLALQAVQIIELDRYINQTRQELQYHFKQEDSDQLLVTGYAHFNQSLRRLPKRLRKQEPQLQSLRHIRASVITHWLRQYNLREVQYMAGHRKILSTELYQRNDIEGLQADIDRFHPMNRKEEE